MSYEDEIFREVFSNLKQYSNDSDKYMSEMVDNAVNLVIERRKKETDQIDNEKVIPILEHSKWILKELYEDYVTRSGSENNISDDIEYIGSGFKSITLRVGDIILKLSKHDYKSSGLPFDSKYKVPTYLEEEYEIGNKTYLGIEVASYVDVKGVSFDDVFSLYSNIRGLGYIWNDPKEENAGRIINVDGCRIGGKVYLPKYQYEKGDLVVLDSEDMAYVGEETSELILEEISMMSYNRNVYTFETKCMEKKKAESQGSKK